MAGSDWDKIRDGMTISQRAATDADEPFLRKLIVDTVTEELQASLWPEPMRSHLLEIQYSARRQSIRTRYPNAEDRIVMVDEIPAGWFAKADLDDEIRWLDLMIAADHRGKGVGTAVLKEAMAESNRARKPARFSVSVMNGRAIQLYEHLGFRRIGGDEVQHIMEYVPA